MSVRDLDDKRLSEGELQLGYLRSAQLHQLLRDEHSRDIVLRTPGATERPYLYTADAVSAILHALLKGEPGEAYTAANPDSCCSIREMAELVADTVADGRIRVVTDLSEDPAKFGYADTLTVMLDISKIRRLGWAPTVSLRDMFARMIAWQKEQGRDS